MFVLPWIPSKKERVYYGGVVDDDGCFVPSSGWHEMVESGYDFDESLAEKCEENVVYIGCMHDVWGHAITDNLKKIWYLIDRKESRKLVYITVGNKPLPKYVFDIFQLVGVDLYKAVHITRVTKFKNVFVPNNSLINVNENRFYTKEFDCTIGRIIDKIPLCSDLPEKIYFTRSQLSSNRDIGEKSVESLFRKHGYTIIAPEKLSIQDQLKFLHNCKVFCSTEGSISHSSIFCRDGISVILIRKVDYVNPYTSFINDMRHFNCTFIKAHHSILSPVNYPWRGPFFLYKTKELASFFGCKFYRPYFLYASWYEYRWGLWTKLKNVFYKFRAIVGFRTRVRQWFQ